MIDSLWVILCAFIVLEMQAGFLCLEAGTVRTKNAGNVAIKNLSDLCVVSLLYWAVGYAIMHGPGGSAWFGWGTSFPDFAETTPGQGPFFLFQLAFAATAVTIVSGAVAERERYVGYLGLAVALGALVYPLVGHWIWGGTIPGSTPGWLAVMGFVDFAGATAVHAVGGWAALAVLIVLGPRLGRFGAKRRRFEEHSIALSALGGILLWVGWGAFNGGSALVFDVDVSRIIVLTILTAASGGATAILASAALNGFVRVDWVLNGMLAGLVAGTAGIHLFGTAGAVASGALGAVAMILCAAVLEAARIDDVVGAVPVHLAPGILGTLLVAVFAPAEALPAGSRLEQLAVQALGCAVVGAVVFTAIGALAALLDRAGMLRVAPRDEVQGLTFAQHRRPNAFQVLLGRMHRHAWTGDFTSKVPVDRASEVGAIALRYNRVLDRVDAEIRTSTRLAAAARRQRCVAEEALDKARQARQQADHALRHDALTGLGNRLALEEAARMGLAEPALVAAIDLDRFKDINEVYGPAAGDHCLRTCAERLGRLLVGPADGAWRIGGDEFAVLLTGARDDSVAAFDCDAIREALAAPIAFGGVRLQVGGSVGFTLFEGGSDLAAALKRAELALHRAKAAGGRQSLCFDAGTAARHDAYLSLLEDFKQALARDQITIRLQPKVAAGHRDVTGFEVLARWDHPDRGEIAPDVFIPIATELRMLGALDRRVLDRALEAWRLVGNRLGAPIDVAVNVSALRLFDATLVEELRGRGDLPETGLSFEILETTLLDDEGDRLVDRIQAIKALGIGIEVDDFGTGHASFASVLALRPDTLKIDRIFVDAVDTDPSRRELLAGILDMARIVSADTVVEGVETEAQARAVEALGARVLQGFHFSRPLTPEAFIRWVQAYRADRRSA